MLFRYKLNHSVKSRNSHQRCLKINGVFRNFARFAGKHLCQSLFFNKVAGLRTMALAQVFSCEFSKTFKNTYSEKHLQTTTSINSWAAVFQERLALSFKWNALTSETSWQHTHSNPVGIFSHFWQLHHPWELNLLWWVSGSSWSLPSLQLGRVHLADTDSNWDPRICLIYSPRKLFKLRRENTCYMFRKRSSELLFFLILFSAGIYLFKVWLKSSQSRYFFLFLFSSGIYLFKLIKTTGSFSKASILTNNNHIVLFFPGDCILLAKVIITCQSKQKTIN